MRSIFTDLERELVDAARQQSGGEPSSGKLSRRLAGVSTALRAVPALAVIAICLVVLTFGVTSLHGRSGSTHGSPGVADPAGTPSTTTQLSPASVQRAPDYVRQLPVLAGAGGKTKSLASYRGQLVLVDFFASWCVPCKTEAPVLAAAQKLLASHHGTVIGIPYEDDRTRALAFLRTYHLSFPVLADDRDSDVARAYDISGVPDSYLINRDGTIVWTSLYGLTSSFVSHTLPRLIAINAGSQRSRGGCSPSISSTERSAVRAILSEVRLLRDPTRAEDESPTACAARSWALNGYGPQPVDLRYVSSGIQGGAVFMYAIPGVSRAVAYRGRPADSRHARSETEPSVCLITVGGGPGSPGGCTDLTALRVGPAGFSSAQIPGTATSVLAGVVRDGITAVRVYDRGQLVKTVPVEHNMVQFIVDHNAPAAVHLRIQPVR